MVGGGGDLSNVKRLSISSVRPIIYQTELTTLVMLWYYLICSLDRQALWVEFVIQPRSTSSPFVTIRVWPIIHSNSAQIASTIKGLFHQDSEHCKNIARIANAVQVTKGSREKSWYFTVRLTIKGGGSATLALTVSKCENFDPFFSMEYYSMVLKTHFISLWGVSKMHY